MLRILPILVLGPGLFFLSALAPSVLRFPPLFLDPGGALVLRWVEWFSGTLRCSVSEEEPKEEAMDSAEELLFVLEAVDSPLTTEDIDSADLFVFVVCVDGDAGGESSTMAV